MRARPHSLLRPFLLGFMRPSLRAVCRALLLAFGLLWSALVTSQTGTGSAAASPNCHGQFMNPITDICWTCAFPLTVAKVTIGGADQLNNDTEQDLSAICNCGNGLNAKVGLTVSFWEPARLVEVVRKPYCFPSLGGVVIDAGIPAPPHGRDHKQSQVSTAFYQVHWYTNPLFFWLQVLVDDDCLEQGSFDLAYMTEVDPLWEDSVTTFILNPDAALFANPIAQAACAADCIAATTGFPLNELFWCAGCQGSMYPLNGWVGVHNGGVNASVLLAERMTNKMHREGLVWAASGVHGLCGYYPQPLMDKTNYKLQMVYPVPATDPIAGQCCQPYGRSTAVWGSGKSFPIKGEDFTYQIFRKRDCCQGAQ